MDSVSFYVKEENIKKNQKKNNDNITKQKNSNDGNYDYCHCIFKYLKIILYYLFCCPFAVLDKLCELSKDENCCSSDYCKEEFNYCAFANS